jgi:hypothetical protein
LQNLNAEMVQAYFIIGQQIVEYEQEGETRGGYGEELMLKISLRLSKEFGRGYSVSNLKNMRQFYLALVLNYHGQSTVY